MEPFFFMESQSQSYSLKNYRNDVNILNTKSEKRVSGTRVEEKRLALNFTTTRITFLTDRAFRSYFSGHPKIIETWGRTMVRSQIYE